MKTPQTSLPSSLKLHGFWILTALVFTLTLSACELLDILEDPTIVSMSVSPSELHLSEVGMTDEFFTVTITVMNFDDEITDAEVFIQNPLRPAVPREITFDGNVIILTGIAKTWFTNLSEGTYNIGAEVRSDTANVRQNNLASVNVFQ